METFFSAILSDLASRSISFLIDKCSKPMAPTMEDRLHSLQRLLLRVRVIVEEAEDRHITNQAMLQKLNILRGGMYRGYYTLDSFRCRGHEEDEAKDHQVSHSFTPSKFNPAKRVCFSNGSGQSLQEQLQQVHGSLEITIEAVSEFVTFLNGCPRLYRQPYSMYLLLDKCMFCRQMEIERIINFLLQAETHGSEIPGVLPIIGPGKVGKSTLIEHACNDETVRNHFSQIVRFSEYDLKDEKVVALRDCGVIKHQNCAVDGQRILVIVELIGDIDEGVWRRLYSLYNTRITSGTRIIVSSQSDKIASFGTTQPLSVQRLTSEAFWYFFKVRTFGSLDADEHPKLASIAMDIAREMKANFMGASIFSGLLKANFNARFWSMALASIREVKQNDLLLHGARRDFADPWHEVEVEPMYVRRVNKTSSEFLVILDSYRTGSVQSEGEAPKMSMQDLLFASASKPQGKFKVLACRSHIPPYYSYMLNCEVRRPQRMVAGKKRFRKNRS